MNFPDNTTSVRGEHDGVLADLLDDLANQLRAGHDADVESMARAYPEHAEALGRLAPAVRMLAEVQREDAADAVDEPSGDSGPTVLGDYRILGELGRGGMGVVYAAEQVSLGRKVALKVLPLAATLDPRRLQRFQNEARAAGCLHHTNIVPVFAVGTEHGVHFYAMQLIDGQTLAAVVREMRGDAAKRTPGSPDADTRRRDADTPAAATGLSTTGGVRNREYVLAVTRLAMQAAEALDYAHQLGVVHRDIKPGNLMIDTRGQLWVTDFGLAQIGQADAGLTLTGDMVGTLRYMSPEQALGQRTVIDHRADVYALGATLYELLTLAPALDGQDRQELLRQMAFEDPTPPRRINPAIPADLETVVLKAMAKGPAERYATAQELADDLRRFLEDKAIRARRPSRLERARKWARRHRSVMWSGALALFATLTVLAGSVGWIVRDQAARDAKMSDDLLAALTDAQRSRDLGNESQAQAAALRAKALLDYAPANPVLTQRVDTVLRTLAEESADRRLLARIDEIRRLQAEGDLPQSHAIEKTLPQYRAAFRDYGWEASVLTPEEAAARLKPRPAKLRAIVLAALDHWLILARYKKLPEAVWLEQVLATADTDEWRQRVREARKHNDAPALERLAETCDVAAQAPETLFMLDKSLRKHGRNAAAVALLRRAQAAFPDDFWINHDLAMALEEGRVPDHGEAIRYLTAAVALRPNSAGARNILALVLFKKGRVAEAADACREATRLQPDYAVAYSNLGLFLWENERFDEAIDAYRKAVGKQPQILCVHCSLGNALCNRGRLEEARAVYRNAIALHQDYAEAHCRLGVVLYTQGKFAEALTALERGHRLGAAQPHWFLPSADWLAQCKRLVELDRRGPEAFNIDRPPASIVARVELARLCQYKQCYTAAARWWSSAFAANPQLADNMDGGHRYSAARAAACAAARADAGDERERARWLRQALAWLQADLAAHRAQLTSGKLADRQRVRQRLRHWHSYPDLAVLRDPAALAELSAAEQAACRQLWVDAADLLRQTAG